MDSENDLHNWALTDVATAETLARYRFDAASFAKNRALLAAGQFPSERNRLEKPLAPPSRGDVLAWPKAGSAGAREYRRLGEAALANGKVAACILNGGMATRFGGMVKCLVPVTDNRTFLELKLRDVAKWPKTRLFIMNSFATEADSARALHEQRHFGLDPARVHLMSQRISLRLSESGELFREASGGASFYAPGHGDVFEVLAEQLAFQEFVNAGGTTVLVSNVDNLGATLDPVVIGAHLAGARPITVELAPKAAGDQGGAPARVGGRLEIVEGFRFPPAFDQAQIPVFNTNTFVLRVDAVRPDWPLNWYRADKVADGQKVVQFERLMGEVTSFADATYLEVPREGDDGRFLPVKTPADLPKVADIARRRWPVK